MSEVDNYLKERLKNTRSFTLTSIYVQYLKMLSTRVFIEDRGYIRTTLKRVIVMEGLNIMKSRQIDPKLWKKTEKVENTSIMILRINEKIEKLLQEVATLYFTSKSHFARYAVMKTFYKYFPEGQIGETKIVSLSKLF